MRLISLISVLSVLIKFIKADDILSCQSQSQPNPIASEYPQKTTGTINGTTAVVMVPFSVARSVIPAQYGIVTTAIKEHFPDLPSDMYPAFVEALHDHDVGMSTTKIPDFTRIALKYPFVDRLNDGYSSFKYTPPQLVGGALVGVLGSEIYGTTIAANFDPPCDAYSSVPGMNDTTHLTAYAVPKSKQLESVPDFDTRFQTVGSIPYSTRVFMNVTNQPSFGSGVPLCDNYITLFNSTVTTGKYAPVAVKGTVSVVPPYYPTNTTFSEVYGYRMDNAFIENNLVPCEQLKGYTGIGTGS